VRYAASAVLVAFLTASALAEPPDISKLPPHPRLWIGGLPSAAGYINPDALAERARTHAAEFALLDQSSAVNNRALYAFVTGDRAGLDKLVSDLKVIECPSGEDLAFAALAFDWIAKSVADADRKAIAAHLGDLAVANYSEAGGRWLPWDNNALRRDMGIGLVALAIAGDDPRAQELLNKAHPLFEEFMTITGDGASPADMSGRAAYGGGWPEGHDYDRHGSRYALIYFLGLRSAAGVDVFTGSAFWKAKPLYHVYTVLPNGKNVLPFQDDDHPSLHRFDREVMLVLAKEYKDAHARWYLNHVNSEQDPSSSSFEFLYNEPSLPEHDYSDLSRAHYIPGAGLVIARSGWGLNDTYVAFLASDWYVYHQNNAQNVFAIYRNAPLAVKDGVYDGDVHEHYVNYSIRTVSYNGITVLDPAEKYHGPDPVPSPANDGGQRIEQWQGDPISLAEWRKQARQSERPGRDVVDWKGFETTDAYTYAAAEAGRAYFPGKVPFFSRQVLFIYPNWIVVFDRVTSRSAAFTKQFHLHAPEEMTLAGNTAVITTRTTNGATTPGRLFVTSLLPAKAKIERVEGFAAYGGHSWVGPKPYNYQLLCPVHLEITAPEETTSFFLTAMYACDAGVDKVPEALVTEETPERVTVSLEGGRYRFSFAKKGEVAWAMLK